MKQDIFAAIYLVVIGAIIIGADILFLRDHFWWRLGFNIAVVAIFATVSSVLYLEGSDNFDFLARFKWKQPRLNTTTTQAKILQSPQIYNLWLKVR